jgi:hypothetical protein
MFILFTHKILGTAEFFEQVMRLLSINVSKEKMIVRNLSSS